MTTTICAVNENIGDVCCGVANTAHSFVSIRQLSKWIGSYRALFYSEHPQRFTQLASLTHSHKHFFFLSNTHTHWGIILAKDICHAGWNLTTNIATSLGTPVQLLVNGNI